MSYPVNTSLIHNIPLPYQGKDIEKIHDTAEKFTSVFFTQFVSEMMKGQEAMGGFGEEAFQSVLAQGIGEQLARSDAGTEMISLITEQLIQLQGKQPPSSAIIQEKKDDF